MHQWNSLVTTHRFGLLGCEARLRVLMPYLWCSSLTLRPSVVWFPVLIMPYYMDCDRLSDAFVTSPFDTSFETNLSRVAVVVVLF